MVGFFFHVLVAILYNSKEEKSIRGLSVEYILKLLSQLPPIPDVPPPQPKKAFSKLLQFNSLKKARAHILYALHEDVEEERAAAKSHSM
jgi:hypothetical protein